MKRNAKRDANLPIGKLRRVKDALPPAHKMVMEALEDFKHKRYVTLREYLCGKRSA